MAYAKVIVKASGQSPEQTFTYRVPQDMTAEIGYQVEVPFGNTQRTGFVLEVSPTCDMDASKVKDVAAAVGAAPVFSAKQLSLARWMSERYLAPLWSTLALFVPRDASRMEEKEKRVQIIGTPQGRPGEKQKRFLALAEAGEASLSKLVRESGIGAASLKALQTQNVIAVTQEAVEDAYVPYAPVTPDVKLNADQQKAFDTVCRSFGTDARFLLYGVTGSGKTEVYMRLIDAVLQNGQNAYLLVPEISLTPQLVERLQSRFAGQVAMLHSRMNDTERSRVWHRVAQGKARVVVGPRSAMFAPLGHVGLLILDEEHETSYKSDQQPRFHTREVALEMSRRESFPVVFGSATPSVESLAAVERQSMAMLRLSKRAVQKATMPSVQIVDMRAELAMGNVSPFSRALTEAIEQRLLKREQTILFLNRKGYSSFVSCRNCGFVLKCPNCYLPYTYHKDKDVYICHHCGKSVNPVSICPQCHSKYIRHFGSGTQRIEEEVRKRFPAARVLRMDAGTTTGKDGFEKVYKQIRDFEADIVVGTQMIAKGVDFPRVTLVGVLNADQTLFYPDFHNTERTFQLLTQVSGRAGRGEVPGEVYIQSYDPEHYVLTSVAGGEYDAFYEKELLGRKLMKCPPYASIMQLLLTDKNEERLIAAASQMKMMATSMLVTWNDTDLEVLGPTPAELGRIDNVFRWKLLVRGTDDAVLLDFTRQLMAAFAKAEPSVSVTPDLNPVHMQ